MNQSQRDSETWAHMFTDVIASCSRTPSCDRWAIVSPGRFRWQGGWDINGRTVFEKGCKGFLTCLVECSGGFLSWCAFPTVIASVGSGACAARIYSATSSLSNDGSICWVWKICKEVWLDSCSDLWFFLLEALYVCSALGAAVRNVTVGGIGNVLKVRPQCLCIQGIDIFKSNCRAVGYNVVMVLQHFVKLVDILSLGRVV